MRTSLTYLLLLLMLPTAGCNILGPIGYIFAPLMVRKKTVDPEFDRLPGKRLAVVIYAGPEMQVDYPLAQVAISDRIKFEFQDKIEDLTVVPSRRVMRYQDENPGWAETSPEKLCRTFRAEYLLYISLVEFSTRDPGAAHLSRGRLTAQAKLYGRPDGPDAGLQWQSEKHFEIVFPPVGQLPAALNASSVRARTEKLFAEELARRFYKHKVEVLEE